MNTNTQALREALDHFQHCVIGYAQDPKNEHTDRRMFEAREAVLRIFPHPPAPEQASERPKDACDEGPCPDPDLCESEQYCCFRASPTTPEERKPEQQSQAGEPEVVAYGAITDYGTYEVSRTKICMGNDELITLQSHREAMQDWQRKMNWHIADREQEIAKKDAALKACVEAMQASTDQTVSTEQFFKMVDAAITQAEEARK